MNTKDTLNRISGLEFMDKMHEYPSVYSNIRYYHRLKARIVNNFIKNNFFLDKVFLDAGSGRGQYCVIASKLFKTVYCDEFDKEELDKAKKFISNQKLNNVIFMNHDLTNLSYPSNSIDRIVCSEVLEHIPKRQDASDELYRVLKPGGKLLLSMPQKNSLFYKHVLKTHRDYLNQPEPEDTNSNLWHFMQHVKFSHKDIESIAQKSGFKIVKRYGANVLPLGENIFRKIYNLPLLFRLYIFIEIIAEKLLPKYASFYFIELTKNND